MGTGWFFNRGKASPEIFLFRDDSVEESDNLPDLDVLAQEIADDLEASPQPKHAAELLRR